MDAVNQLKNQCFWLGSGLFSLLHLPAREETALFCDVTRNNVVFERLYSQPDSNRNFEAFADKGKSFYSLFNKSLLMEKKSAIIKPVSHEFYIILTIKNCKLINP